MHFDWSQIVESSSSPATKEEVTALEASIGFPLPEDYKQFLLTLNGGYVTYSHAVPFDEPISEFGVSSFLSTARPKPHYDLFQQRRHQVRNKWGARQSIIIGDDGVSGRILLMLDGAMRGYVFFGFQDELDNLSAEWDTNRILVTDPMHFITDSFDHLGELILQNPAS